MVAPVGAGRGLVMESLCSLRRLSILGPGSSSFGFCKPDVRLGKQIPAFNENSELRQSKGAGRQCHGG